MSKSQRVWKKTTSPGVRYREHSTRKIRNSPMKDKYFAIYYRLDGKLRWEGLGWLSQGITLDIASHALSSVKAAIKSGAKAVTLKEQRALASKERIETANKQKTFIEYWDIYMNRIRMTLSPKSFNTVRGFFQHRLLTLFGDVILSDFNMTHWEHLMNTLNESNLTPRSKQYISSELRKFLASTKESGFELQAIPAIKQLGLTSSNANRRERIITPYEASEILRELLRRDINAYFITKFAFLTGCRISEASGLKWVDIYPDSLVFLDTKNSSNRRIALTQELRSLFEEVKTAVIKPNDYVFPNSLGEPYKGSPQAFWNAVRKLGFNGGHERLDKITFHSIRHTVASKMAQLLDIRSLMDFMGWKQVDMAARYIHSNRDATAKVAAILSELFHDPKKE